MYNDSFSYSGYGRGGSYGRGGGRHGRGGGFHRSQHAGSRGWMPAVRVDFAPDVYATGSFGGRGRLIRVQILNLLKSNGPKNSAAILQSLEESGWFPNPARFYSLLSHLESLGLIRAAEESSSGRSLELTDAGTGYLNAAGGEGFSALWQAIRATVSAARQVSVGADPERTARAVELLNEARKGLYSLVSEKRDDSAGAN